MQNKKEHLTKSLPDKTMKLTAKDKLKIIKFKAAVDEVRKRIKKYANGKDLLEELYEMRRLDDKDLA